MQHKHSENSPADTSPEETHPIPVVVKRDELPLSEPLVDGEVRLAVEEVGHGAVHHTEPHPVEQFAEEHLPLLPLTLSPLFVFLFLVSVVVWLQARLLAALRFIVGGGGPRDGASSLRLHTPAVSLTVVALDGQVTPGARTLRHEGGRLAHRLLGGLQPRRLAVNLSRHHGLLGLSQAETGGGGLVLLVRRGVVIIQDFPPAVLVLLRDQGREEAEGN